jgi:hypothetical protein
MLGQSLDLQDETETQKTNIVKIQRKEENPQIKTGTYVGTPIGQALFVGIETPGVVKVQRRGKIYCFWHDQIEHERQYVTESHGTVNGYCTSSQTY